MEIFTTKIALDTYLSSFRSTNGTIGFVATMGALHEGHLALIRQSKQLTELTVCSIFVNPTQFNDPTDLEKYPRPIEQDIALLQSVACDVLFMPSVNEMYPDQNEHWHLDLGGLDLIWEGAHRPGHYQGVTQVVKKLFDAIQPTVAFFGQKDFQQCMVIQRMVEQLGLAVQLKIVETVRDPDGLAMSSRNVRLSSEGRKNALALSRALFMVKQKLNQGESLLQLKREAVDFLQQSPGITLEYFAICASDTLTEIEVLEEIDKPLVAILAAWVDGVRLIDNVLLIS
ncbi:pantoate--beta-alanine ligase [Olivibacter ginsenosidimutans]|uniref:Pantothenate synthetase n=1 Tax=Olivibacter ginsenosidimutans TaxID=1176537 RepID=A0ABP9AP32_9SPHI